MFFSICPSCTHNPDRIYIHIFIFVLPVTFEKLATALCFQTDALSKAYPNFVNYFEKTKETIQECERLKPRFHAFLRVCRVYMMCCFCCSCRILTQCNFSLTAVKGGESKLWGKKKLHHFIFTALHAMQTRSSDEISVCLSVRPSVKHVHCDKMEEKSVRIFILYDRTFILVFLEEVWLVGGDPFYLKFWVNQPTLEQNRRIWTDNRL